MKGHTHFWAAKVLHIFAFSLDIVNDVSVTLRPSLPREKSLDLGGWVHIRATENLWPDAGT